MFATIDCRKSSCNKYTTHNVTLRKSSYNGKEEILPLEKKLMVLSQVQSG